MNKFLLSLALSILLGSANAETTGKGEVASEIINRFDKKTDIPIAQAHKSQDYIKLSEHCLIIADKFKDNYVQSKDGSGGNGEFRNYEACMEKGLK